MSSTREPPFRSVRTHDRRRLRTAQRVALVAALLVLLTILATIATTWVLVASRIEGTSVVALDREPDSAMRNVVVALAPGPDGPVDGVFVLQASGERDQPAVLVLPVNLEVDVADRGVFQLGEVADAGGMALLVEEVGEYTGLDIHHYVRVDRVALAEAIDRNGGITDCPTADALACPNVLGADVLASLAPPTDAVSGPDRVQALADTARLVGGEVSRLRTLVDPRRALRWADEWSQVLRTDVDPGLFGLRDLGRLLAGVDPGTLQVRVLPGLVDGGRLTVTPEEAQVLLDAFATGARLPGDVGLEAPRELVPEDVVIKVLNGVGTAGAASEMTEFLEDRGFQTVEPDNAPRFDDRSPTTIGYASEEELPLAQLVASFLPGAELKQLVEPPPEGVQVVVTVGANGIG